MFVLTESLIMQLQTSEIEHADEETQIAWAEWISAADELIQDNTVPPSSIESMGKR